LSVRSAEGSAMGTEAQAWFSPIVDLWDGRREKALRKEEKEEEAA